MSEPQLVDGVWLPAGETHLIEHMAKNRRLVDGKGTYQYQKLEAALRLVPERRRRLALDIGAHVGLWSMHLAKQFTRLIAYEPVPMLRALWLRNVPARNAELVGSALGNETGSVTMQIPVETTGNAHVAIAGRHPGTRGVAHPERVDLVENVPMHRLDSLGLVGVDFIKIDVEGFEKQVLLGGEKTIRRDKPVIVVEQKGNDVAYGDKPKAALGLLERWGFKVEAEIGGDYVVKYCPPCGALRAAGRAVMKAVRP